jgi:hypothetical protein
MRGERGGVGWMVGVLGLSFAGIDVPGGVRLSAVLVLRFGWALRIAEIGRAHV